MMAPIQILAFSLALSALGMWGATKLADQARLVGSSPWSHPFLVSCIYAITGVPLWLMLSGQLGADYLLFWELLVGVIFVAAVGHTGFAVKGIGKKLATFPLGLVFAWLVMVAFTRLLSLSGP